MPDGRVQHGCDGIPLDRPLLLVSNHQTFAFDIGLLIDGLLRQTGLLPRGLTHPAVFQVKLAAAAAAAAAAVWECVLRCKAFALIIAVSSYSCFSALLCA